MTRTAVCPNCQSKEQFLSKEVSSGGGYAPNYLPGLGSHWGLSAAKFRVVVCGQCGLTRFFASEDALAKLRDSAKWERLTAG